LMYSSGYPIQSVHRKETIIGRLGKDQQRITPAK